MVLIKLVLIETVNDDHVSHYNTGSNKYGASNDGTDINNDSAGNGGNDGSGNSQVLMMVVVMMVIMVLMMVLIKMVLTVINK